jgi:hypothetical protein
MAMNPLSGAALVAYVLDGGPGAKAVHSIGIAANGQPAANPLRVSSDNADVRNLSLKFGPQGEAIALWTQVQAGVGDVLMSAVYRTSTSAWQQVTPQVASPFSGATGVDVSDVDLTFDAQGNAVAVWSESAELQSPKKYRVMSARLEKGATSWTSAQVGPTDTTLKNFGPRVVTLPSGDYLVATLSAFPGHVGNRTLLSYRCTLPLGPSSCSEFAVPSFNKSHVGGFDLAVNGKGLAAIVWSDTAFFGPGEITRSVAYEAHLKPDGKWSEPTGVDLFEVDDRFSEGAGGTAVAVDPAGNLLVLWTQKIEPFLSSPENLYARIIPTSGSEARGEPLLLESSDQPMQTRPFLSMDSAGNMLVAWVQRTAPSVGSLYASRYNVQKKEFEAPSLAEAGDATVQPNGVATGLADGGKGMVIWFQDSKLFFNHIKPATP